VSADLRSIIDLLRDYRPDTAAPVIETDAVALLDKIRANGDWSPPDDVDEAARFEQAAEFARDVERESHTLRVRDAARRKIAAEIGGDTERPKVVGLRDFLAVPDPEIIYRVDRLWPAGGRTVLAAQWKAGKTTVVGNLIRALADGGLFLDTFRTTSAARIALLDDELDERTLRRWLRDQQIVKVDAVRLVPLRGRAASFNILDPQTRAEWVAALRGADVIILDCLRPILDGLGLDESREAGRFLVAFDTLLAEIGNGSVAADGLVVHHMGHNVERSRGDSRILDWPDATWKVVRQKPDDPASARYLSAFGRDVEVTEGRLEYDPAGRRLRFVGGTRIESAADALWPDLKRALDGETEGLSGRAVVDSLTNAGNTYRAARDALARAVNLGKVQTRRGPRNAILHTLSASVLRSDTPALRDAECECDSAPIGRTTHTLTPQAGSKTASHSDDPELDQALHLVTGQLDATVIEKAT
jgi:hypothetical protein